MTKTRTIIDKEINRNSNINFEIIIGIDVYEFVFLLMVNKFFSSGFHNQFLWMFHECQFFKKETIDVCLEWITKRFCENRTQFTLSTYSICIPNYNFLQNKKDFLKEVFCFLKIESFWQFCLDLFDHKSGFVNFNFLHTSISTKSNSFFR